MVQWGTSALISSKVRPKFHHRFKFCLEETLDPSGSLCGHKESEGNVNIDAQRHLRRYQTLQRSYREEANMRASNNIEPT
jgi:hypothetical protein